ncbi:MAG: transposase, partial [Candidatus Methanoperedens sp.]|nr:transposase [Candidatus Methanoperedens sp.]
VLPQVKSYYMSILTGIFCNHSKYQKDRHLNYLVTHLLKDTLKTLDRQIDFRIRTNSRYHQEDIFNLILTASVNTTSVENTVIELKDVKNKKNIPSADIVLHHIERQKLKEIEYQLEQAINSSHQMAEKRRLFGKYAAVAIDIHEIPYYGKVNNPFIMGCKHKNGTSYCYKYATIDIVEKNQRFTLKAIPLTPLSNNNATTVSDLLRHAMKYVHIKYVLLDRGFFSIDVIKALESLKLKYIMPAIKNDKIKQVLKNNSDKISYFLKYTMRSGKKDATFNLMVKYDEKGKEYYTFATNFQIVYKEDIKSIAEMYKKRWGIETGYRVKKDFLAITTTKCYIVRMLYFMVSVILYNFWLLCNLVYCREHGIELGTPKITTQIMKLYIGLYLNNVNKESTADLIEKPE